MALEWLPKNLKLLLSYIIDSPLKMIHDEPEEAMKLLSNSQELKVLKSKCDEYKETLRIKSRTSRYWLQYLHYVDVLKLFIRAERTGHWSLHLHALSKMINLFAATGRIHYAKCARMHLQNMLQLETDYPWVYKNFTEHGFHTVRRSDRYWSGLWTDLIIEQVLMRALKSRGGLTRGRGVTESVRLV